jgi:chaperonin cofactor prefoldin
MSDDSRDPTNADIITALQGMWRQQNELLQGVESRLGSKLDATEERLGQRVDRLERNMDEVETRLERRIDEVEQHLSERIAREIHDRPVVVPIDMSRVGQLEKQVEVLTRRLDEIEARLPS